MNDLFLQSDHLKCATISNTSHVNPSKPILVVLKHILACSMTPPNVVTPNLKHCPSDSAGMISCSELQEKHRTTARNKLKSSVVGPNLLALDHRPTSETLHVFRTRITLKNRRLAPRCLPHQPCSVAAVIADSAPLLRFTAVCLQLSCKDLLCHHHKTVNVRAATQHTYKSCGEKWYRQHNNCCRTSVAPSICRLPIAGNEYEIKEEFFGSLENSIDAAYNTEALEVKLGTCEL